MGQQEPVGAVMTTNNVYQLIESIKESIKAQTNEKFERLKITHPRLVDELAADCEQNGYCEVEILDSLSTYDESKLEDFKKIMQERIEKLEFETSMPPREKVRNFPYLLDDIGNYRRLPNGHLFSFPSDKLPAN
jgi:hypothetical protein